MGSMMDFEEHKRVAGWAAADLVESGMRVGFGTGSTAAHFTQRVGDRMAARDLVDIQGVPTSRATAEQMLDLQIPVVDLDGRLDLAVDGADEIAPGLELIKGGGGALLREKIVAAAATRFVVVAHALKVVAKLGETFRLPVEVARFGAVVTAERLQRFGTAEMRGGTQPFVTDNGNFIVDIDIGQVGDGAALDAALCAVPGVVETGLFVGMADMALIGSAAGVEQMFSNRPADG